MSAASLESLSDLRTPWCLHVAVTLRIAEHMEAGKQSISELAAAAGCDSTALSGILSHLARKGVFHECRPGHFILNDTARGLLDPGVRLGLDLDAIGGRMAHAWGTLLQYARTGQPAYADLFGRPFWEDLDAHPEIGASFDAIMGPDGHGAPDPALELTGGWESVRTLVDVGGGTGAMLVALLQRHPHLHGTLVDLPRAAERAAAAFAAAGVAERAAVAGQSFFDALPSGADVYLLRKVIQNWADNEAATILRRCAEAAGSSGRMLVVKSVTSDAATPGIEIDMLLTGGKRRSLEQFRALAREAGLEITAASGSVVECHRA